MDSPTSSHAFRSDLLAGQTAMVTGSSSGIGRAIAIAIAGAGADVHLHACSNATGLAEVRSIVGIRSIEGAGGGDFMADLREPDACRDLAEKVWNTGPVDIWVNNAGVDVLTGVATDWSFEEKLAALWEGDVRATVTLSRTIGFKMQERGSGVILNIGWDQVETGMAGDSGEMFAATKGAIMAFTRSLAKSLAPDVRVNALAPGWIRTKWGEGASDQWNQRARGESLLDQWGEPGDVASAALFLASPAASFITGQVLLINGGLAGCGSKGFESVGIGHSK